MSRMRIVGVIVVAFLVLPVLVLLCAAGGVFTAVGWAQSGHVPLAPAVIAGAAFAAAALLGILVAYRLARRALRIAQALARGVVALLTLPVRVRPPSGGRARKARSGQRSIRPR